MITKQAFFLFFCLCFCYSASGTFLHGTSILKNRAYLKGTTTSTLKNRASLKGTNTPLLKNKASLKKRSIASVVAESKEHYFVCDVLKTDIREKPRTNKPFDGSFDYFDKIFFYKQNNRGDYLANYFGQDVAFKFDGEFIYSSFLAKAGEQDGFYRQIFELYRFDLQTQVLTHSYIYYLDPKDFDKNFNNASFVPYNSPFLFDFIEQATPKDYVKLGWDKTRWTCYSITYFKYMLLKIKALSFLFAG